MYVLKQKPGDFVVEEITNVKPQNKGRFVYFWMKKQNLNTLQAIEYIAKALHINPKFINFAGTKDKVAVTTQLISIKGKTRAQIEKLQFKEISLNFFGYKDEQLHLGELVGNRFKIVLREVEGKIPLKKRFVNYFGEQRLSKYNAIIGKAIIKKDFNVAIDIIGKSNSFYFRKIKKHLDQKPNDYITALKLLPKKLLKLFISSYQSHMWNETVRLYLQKNKPKENIDVPMIGFGLEVCDLKLKKIISKIMKIEEISFRDFLIRALPDLSVEGDMRALYMDIKDFKIARKGKQAVVTFTLGKGSYATEVVRQLFEK